MTTKTATQATATFGIDGWDEQPTFEGDGGRKITRATVTKGYHGDLEGTGVMEYVMAYAPDGTATFVGIERFEGRLGDRRGTFVMRDGGEFRDGVAASSFEILAGSGTGELTGLRGTASVDAVKADTQSMRLTYEFDD
jgi:hypothetical protein